VPGLDRTEILRASFRAIRDDLPILERELWGRRSMMKLELRRGPDPPGPETLPEKPSLRRELFWMMVSVLAGLMIFLYFVVMPNGIDW
jgi:hypothetical protein